METSRVTIATSNSVSMDINFVCLLMILIVTKFQAALLHFIVAVSFLVRKHVY